MNGQLTIINLHECDKNLMKDKRALKRFGVELCNVIYMVPHGHPIVKRFGSGKLQGYSLVQLIETSNITVHLDEFENKAFIDIFSCKNFDPKKAEKFSVDYFKSKTFDSKTIFRK
jgi:S-adenosylmethionine/arginine decarboxylase-like enzyme